jgi:hypothetical protein
MSLHITDFDARSVASIYRVDKTIDFWPLNAKYIPKASISLSHASPQETITQNLSLSNENDVLFNSVVPPHDQRICGAIFGQSGTGKSTYVAKFCQLYLKQNPKSICVIVKPDEDRAYTILDESRCLFFTPQELFELDLSRRAKSQEQESDLYNKFHNVDGRTLFVFDDTETQYNKFVTKFLEQFQLKILELGRKKKFDALCVLHAAAKFGSKLLQVLCIEATFIFAAKLSLYSSNLEYSFEKKFYVKKSILAYIKSQKDHYFVLVRSVPNVIVMPSRIFCVV